MKISGKMTSDIMRSGLIPTLNKLYVCKLQVMCKQVLCMQVLCE